MRVWRGLREAGLGGGRRDSVGVVERQSWGGGRKGSAGVVERQANDGMVVREGSGWMVWWW